MLAAGLIVLATAAAFSSSFAGSLVFDDESSISKNPTIRQLWPIWPTLCPPRHGETVTGRPLLNLSLAINFAISGDKVWSYHAANLAIHILAALLLFGVLRQTFLLPVMRDRWGAAALPLASVIALLWAVHPLQTESVTYTVQRAESLVALFYLLTLYCFIRGASVEGSGVRGQGLRKFSVFSFQFRRIHPSSSILPSVAWYAGSVSMCLLGMATKEVMVSAPLIVLLYDRTFCAGSFREAWRRRYGLYLCLAATWLLLGWLVISTGNRGGSAGFGVRMSCWAYLGTQFGAIVHYLKLCVWPHPLLFDYGQGTAQGVMEIAPYAILVGVLVVATVVAVWRWPKVGFLGAWFFAILAPSSTVVPVATQTIAEHRMYLPLAAVICGLVAGGFLAGRWLVRRGKISLLASQVMGGALTLLAGVALGILTFQRNVDYRSELSIWEDTVAKAPGNARAQNNLGLAQAGRGQMDEAMAHYRKALELKPDAADTHNNLGNALTGRGQIDEAMAHYRKALELTPDYAEAHNNLGVALAGREQFDEAITQCEKALELRPDYAEARGNLGNIMACRGQIDEAIAEYRKALEIRTQDADLHCNLGVALARCGRFDEAITEYEKALEIESGDTKAQRNLGIVQPQREGILKTLARQRDSLRSRPDDVALLNDTAWLLATNPNASIRNGAEAIELAERAVQLSDGREPAILGTLAAAYAEAGRFAEAVKTAEHALTLATDRNNSVLAETLQARIKLYRAGSPYRDTQQASGSKSIQP